jgi:hypothetical protein
MHKPAQACIFVHFGGEAGVLTGAPAFSIRFSRLAKTSAIWCDLVQKTTPLPNKTAYSAGRV